MHGTRAGVIAILAAAFAAGGCILRDPGVTFDPDFAHYEAMADSTGYPQIEALGAGQEFALPPSPHTIGRGADQVPPWEMTLEEAIEIAIARSPVMRDLGASIVRAPALVPTILEPAIRSSDPRQGMEAALSAFDATLATGLFFENNHRLLNNFFSAGGTNSLRQDYALLQASLQKQSAAGTQFAIRNSIAYDRNNSEGNEVPQAFDTILETEVRQPLLQGAGVAFNRIAGPNAVPGVTNGVMVARLNTDVSVLEFEMALRDLVSNVENAYWDLYFAYRDLDAKITARDISLDVWRKVDQQVRAQQRGSDETREAQFREQYYRFQEEVQNALTGRLLDGTMTYNGSSGGTFRGLGGVHVTERRLRLLLGLEINDARLIRPASAPSLSRVAFDWEMSLTEAMMRRSEIRRQRLKVQQRELELLAARNFLLPQFDVVARYRWRGLGRNWLGDYPDADPAAAVEFGQSSLENLFGGKFEEWQLGGELTFPIGFRRAHAAVRNAQLQTARERAVLDEQERRVLFDLSNAIADLDRAYEISQTAFNRRAAAKQQMDILLYRQQRGVQPNVDQQPNLDQLIDAQRRFADADSQYHRALAEYMIAVKNVHYEKGTLLEYCQVHLAEPSGIGCDYSPAVRERWLRNRRFRVLDYVLRRPVADCEMVASPEKASEQAPIEQIEPPVVPESLRFESVPPQPAG